MAQNGVHAMVVYSRARQNPYYRAAMEASPQYLAAAALRAKLIEVQQNLPGVPAVQAPENADADIAAWLDAVAAAESEERAREVKYNALQDRLIWCDKVVQDVAVVETDRILSHLDDDLRELMAQVNDVVQRLDGAANPQEVIDRGVSDAWKQLSPLYDEYKKIRTAQHWAMAGEDLLTWSRSDYLIDDPVASDIVLRNLDELYPEWKVKSGNAFRLSGAPEDDPRPWPQEPIAQLVWLCTSSAQPWVPTISQLHELHRERTARRNPTPTAAPKPSQRPTLERIH